MSHQEPQHEALAVVRLSGPAADSNGIPAEVLVRTLSGMQQLVYLVASDSVNRKLGQRFRVSDDIEQGYRLICKLPQAGSYSVPLALEGRNLQLTILPPDYATVFDRIEAFFTSVVSGQINSVNSHFSDQAFAKRALVELRKFLPKADDSWRFGFGKPQAKSEIVLTKDTVKQIDQYLREDLPLESITTITGELIKIDFDERMVYLRYPPTRQQIECIYSNELEDVMIENRRQYIQVTGQFTVDSNGNPIRLTDVTRIEPLDLSPIVLHEVSFNDRNFRFRRPLQLTPELEPEGKQLLTVENPQLGINVFAYSREALLEEISEQIAFLWDDYALSEDDSLTPEAIALKYAVLELVEPRDAA